MNRPLLICAASCLSLFAGIAQAEEASASASTSAAPSGTVAGPAAKVEDSTPDHERLVGHFGVRYFGINSIPIGAPGAGAGNTVTLQQQRVSAPFVGVRYWFKRDMGFDIGLGFGWSGGSSEVSVPGANTVVSDAPSRLALGLHGGLPLALAHGKHFSFLGVPEVRIGYATGSQKVLNANPIDSNGLLLMAGGRVGAEIYFGFIGVPELALEGSVGLYLRHESYKWQQQLPNGVVSASQSGTQLSTSVQSDPWAIFTNNISATYYF